MICIVPYPQTQLKKIQGDCVLALLHPIGRRIKINYRKSLKKLGEETQYEGENECAEQNS